MKSEKIKSPKVIADPLYGIVDIRPVLAMVETPEFQALGDKRQLGMSYLIFPSATHTRKAHSLGAYHATRELGRHWIELGIITQREADALAGYALFHDIGHPALSHVTEPLCEMPQPEKAANKASAKNDYAQMSMNSALSLAIIRRRRHEIEACGIDFELLESFAAHRNPLHLAVSDKNLGMEKLDYLERDGLYTILSRPIGVDYLRNHIYFVKSGANGSGVAASAGTLAIDEKAVDNALETQNYYLKMYKNVYLRKTSAIAQRMLQKMVHRLILAGEITPADLIDLTDSELFGMMRLTRDPLAAKMYSQFKRRELYREAIVLRPSAFVAATAGSENNATGREKNIATFGIDTATIDHLVAAPQFQIENQTALAAAEAEIAELAGLPPDSVLVVPIISPDRFIAQDILVYRGRNAKPASLKARYPAHFRNIEEVAGTYAAFRICTTEKYRAALSSPRVAKKVFEKICGGGKAR
jgi:HD superfamily phosphohydrolase